MNLKTTITFGKFPISVDRKICGQRIEFLKSWQETKNAGMKPKNKGIQTLANRTKI